MIDVTKREKALIREPIIKSLREVKDWIKAQPLKPEEKSQALLMIFVMSRRLSKLGYKEAKDLLEVLRSVQTTTEKGEISPSVLAMMGQNESTLEILREYSKEEVQEALREALPFVNRVLNSLIQALDGAVKRIEAERGNPNPSR